MARKTTDLFDVFGPGQAAKARLRPARGSPRRKGKRRPKSRFQGLFLGPRQLLLGSSVIVLLLLLAFTVGLGLGRRGARRDASPALQAVTLRAGWYVRGKVGRRSFDNEPVPAERLFQDLVVLRHLPSDRLRVRVLDEERWEVLVGPFASEADAVRFYEDWGLETARVPHGTPFRRREIVRLGPGGA